MTLAQRKILLISSLGGVIEFYDFIVYALLAGVLSNQFFPQTNPLLSLMATFATYAVGYLVRPLGGLVFAHFGDTRGRKKPFTTAVLMMACVTFSIGLLPTYQQIGFLSPLLLIVLRIGQGFSLGGELPGAITYISEQIPTQRGLACGIIFAATSFGAVLGSVVIASMQAVLSPQMMSDWGWRCVFLFGGLLGFVSYAYRRYLIEAKGFEFLDLRRDSLPIQDVLRSYQPTVLLGFSLMALGATVATLLSIYIPAYLSQVVHHSPAHIMWYQAIALTFSGSISILIGRLTDRFGPEKFIISFCLVALTAAYPAYLLLAYYPSMTLWAMLLGTTGNAICWGSIPRYLGEIFPAKVRYTGIALCYNLGFALFGGVTPLLATYLIYMTDQVVAPAYIVQCVAMVALVMFFALAKLTRLSRIEGTAVQ